MRLIQTRPGGRAAGGAVLVLITLDLLEEIKLMLQLGPLEEAFIELGEEPAGSGENERTITPASDRRGRGQGQLVHGPADRDVKDAPFLFLASGLIDGAAMGKAVLDQPDHEDMRP